MADTEHSPYISIMFEAASAFFAEEDPRGFFDTLLKRLLHLTESEYGFFAEVEFDEEGDPYLSSWAVTDISWDDATRAYYLDRVAQGLPFEFRRLDTLYGHVLTTRTPVVTNDAAHHPAAAGVPEGHPPLVQFLGVPLLLDGRLVGMYALANRKAGYDDAMVRSLRPITDTGAFLVQGFKHARARADAERALEAARREAERMSELKGQFVSEVSHELRTPLNALSGFGQLLELTDLDEVQAGFVARIRTATDQMIHLVDDLVDLEQIERGAIELQVSSIDLGSAVAEAVAMATPMVEARGSSLVLTVEGVHHVRSDRLRVGQIIGNLLNNAAKYGADGDAIEVRVDAVDGRVEVSVRDHGPGIPPERIEEVFQPFTQLDPHSAGAGIGLTIVRRLCDALGIEMSVDSTLEEGTTMRLAFSAAP